ncbi:GNAT family N-acetyltransferase [Erysipelothrix urinaevulpis]|uniref:GNAT family N-acetyltransferase n=1 Tax=Erysipelothrix urinaevulpis TaxID=2683717 RepID=UPI00135A6552|nr:GNAT family N-acetyltransferase [Erysipelothrix urinaevulpis]
MYKIEKIKPKNENIEEAALWFSKKWSVPKEAYHESMTQDQVHNFVPSWYIVRNDQHKIIAGVGVIENDFHDHVHLSPNVCALYVEEDYRGKQIARKMLSQVEKDSLKAGYQTIYLVTDHRHFYEKLGWDYRGLAKEDDGNSIRLYQKDL